MTAAHDEVLIPEAAARGVGVASSSLIPTDWSADGQRLLFGGGEPADIWLLTLAEPAKPVRIIQSPGDQMHATFSPDGGFIAYTSNESGRFDVYAQSLSPPLASRRYPSTAVPNRDGAPTAGNCITLPQTRR